MTENAAVPIPVAAPVIDQETLDLLPIKKLNADIRAAAATLGVKEARWLVQNYYRRQEARIKSDNQESALTKLGEPHAVIAWLAGHETRLETQIAIMLRCYAEGQPLGRWAMSQIGIAGTLAAGLLAHVRFEKRSDGTCFPPTVGHVWSYAGLDPRVKWLGKTGAADLVESVMGKDKAVTSDHLVAISERCRRRVENIIRGTCKGTDGNHDETRMTRANLVKFMSKPPWNQDFKLLCFKIGQSFMKVSGNPNSKYGLMYAQRRVIEDRKNDAGEFREQAEESLRSKKYDKSTPTYASYASGKLPPGRIQRRACRYATKIFLSNYWEFGYKLHFKADPPKPFAIAMLGHAHHIPPTWGPKREEDKT